MIYLATESCARKKLFKIFGLRFRVIPAKIKEKRHCANFSYAELVKSNALQKAKKVSAKVKSGIIISADTISVQDKKIFGKPKDLKQAKRMLRQLTRKPQTVYTGLAVIDKDKNKALLGYEKTKVYMDRLTDKEIDAYFKRVSPLDKAGSFDIQGRGAFFISRIEGCFYNVVGLPLGKLYRMLQKAGVVVLFLCFVPAAALLISGCSHEYNIVTGEEESYYYSTDKEEQMGRAISREVEKEYKSVDDPLIQKRVEDIGKRIAAVCDRKDIDYSFKVLKDEEVNAFSLPGGFVYVNTGLVERAANDDELAAVLGHEIGHIVARHSIKKLQAMQGYTLLGALLAVASRSSGVSAAADTAFTELLLGYSREDELLADQLGAKYLKLAGYNPNAMITFLEKLQEVNRRKPLAPFNYFKTHPYVPDRIRAVKQELGEKIEYKDFINIEQEPHK